MIFLGIDAAWGDVNETGVVALDSAGTIIDADWMSGLSHTITWVCERAEADTLVFVDAPLRVTNESGQRLCEKHVGQRYGLWKVSANSTNIHSPRQGGVALCKALEAEGFSYDDGFDGPPLRGRVISECYPYTAIVGYGDFQYDERPLYKRKPKKMSVATFRPLRAQACDNLLDRLATLSNANPPIDLQSHPHTRELLHEKSPVNDRAYKHREDLLDAAICAWTAALWHRHGFHACQVLGGGAGVQRPAATIIAPARSVQRAH